MPLRRKVLLEVKENKKILEGTGNPILNRTRDKPILLFKRTEEECELDDRQTYLLLRRKNN